MELKILLIDDDPKVLEGIAEILNGESIEGNTLFIETADFEKGFARLKEAEYDLLILDLFKGPEREGGDKKGEEILTYIQSTTFVPVIFFTALPKYISHLTSLIIRVVGKGEGIEKLKTEIASLIGTGFIEIKRKIYEFTKRGLREYFWDFINQSQELVEKFRKDETSIGYLLMRRLANQLSKDRIKSILGDPNIPDDKAHPMEFYIYPPLQGEFELGDIIIKGEELFVILTPSCDFVIRPNGKRKAERALLSKALPLESFKQHQDYKTDQSEGNKNKLVDLINNKSDRYFFLPGTPFMNSRVIDFHDKLMVPYEELRTYRRLTKLDSPFAEAMLSSFIRYYNRVGFPNVDSDYLLTRIQNDA